MVLIAGADWSLTELKTWLIDNGITGAPVVGASGELVGVVSSTDLLRNDSSDDSGESVAHDFYAESLGRSLSGAEMRTLHVEVDSGRTVADIMTPMVFSVDAGTELDEVADVMVRGRVHRVLVTRGGKVAGIISALDLVKALRDVVRASAAANK
jgi:CBS domain-containing protein